MRYLAQRCSFVTAPSPIIIRFEYQVTYYDKSINVKSTIGLVLYGSNCQVTKNFFFFFLKRILSHYI